MPEENTLYKPSSVKTKSHGWFGGQHSKPVGTGGGWFSSLRRPLRRKSTHLPQPPPRLSRSAWDIANAVNVRLG